MAEIQILDPISMRGPLSQYSRIARAYENERIYVAGPVGASVDGIAEGFGARYVKAFAKNADSLTSGQGEHRTVRRAPRALYSAVYGIPSAGRLSDVLPVGEPADQHLVRGGLLGNGPISCKGGYSATSRRKCKEPRI
jgi:hypothetical protein